MSSRMKKIKENTELAIQKMQQIREENENISGIANSSDAFGNCNIFNEALSPEDVAEMIRDAEIILEDDFCIRQQQPDLTPQTVEKATLVSKGVILDDDFCSPQQQMKSSPETTVNMEKGRQEESQSSRVNLIEEESQLDNNIEKNCDSEKTTKDDVIMDTLENDTMMESRSDSDDEMPLRKRKRTKSQNKREHNKKLKMSGKKYIGFRKPKDQKNTFHDTTREERRLQPRCNCKDRSKQCRKFTDDDRKNIFSKFWSMSWEQRKVFVATTVKVCDRKRPEAEHSRRSITLRYHLILHNTHLSVCKLMYLNTLSLGEWSARSWALSASSGMINCDSVKLSTKLKRKDVFKEDREFLEEFLTKLNKLPSHYCRKDTDRLYLEQTFQSWNDLFRVYQEQCKDENRKALSFKLLRQITKEKKIGLFSPRKDQCDVCFMFKNGNVAEEDYKKHIEAKNKARAEKERDKAQALEKMCHVITMDIQAVKLSPQIPASTLYYKTKLCCHNFTVYDLATKEVVCYWYNETQADGQASTYASFLVDFLEETLFLKGGDKTPIIIYSDGCTAQNRNAILANALLYLSEKYDVKITQKFLEKGHTQMECDSVHSTIETRLKK